MKQERIAIVGAGLVGSMWAVYMAQKGYRADVYEGRPDMRKAKTYGGRSINLALSERGLKALDGIGLKERALELCIPMKARMVHDLDGKLSHQPYGLNDEAINSVSRGGLNKLLLEEADTHGGVNLYFNRRCTGVDLETNTISFHNSEADSQEHHQYDLIFGTDGAFSAVRESLMKTPRFNYSQHYIPHGYKELTIPGGKDGTHRIEKNVLHIWPRKHFMLIALPNLDGSFTCTLFLDFEGETSFENLNTDNEIRSFFETYFKDALPFMPDLLQDFRDNPTAPLVTVRSSPWHYRDNVLIMGDASHAIVPFYGQGMNAGFEDCRVLSELIDKEDGKWSDILPAYSSFRPEDANAIADLALQNFVEMRDSVADPHFLKKRTVSRKIGELMPEQWTPLYSMVSFTNVPYSEALAEGKRQDAVLEKIVAQYPDVEALTASSDFAEKIKPYLN